MFITVHFSLKDSERNVNGLTNCRPDHSVRVARWHDHEGVGPFYVTSQNWKQRTLSDLWSHWL